MTGLGELTLFVLIMIGLYFGSCLLYPFGSCPWCGNKTRTKNTSGKYFRHTTGIWGVQWLHEGIHPGRHGSLYRRQGARLLGRGRQ